MRTLLKVAAFFGLAAGAYAVFVRPRLLRWGAEDEELTADVPGAKIIPGGKRGATMAVTLHAPPSQVWPWLVQLGCNRAGWYSWDRLDNLGKPSARRIHPEWQGISVGQRIPSTPNGKHWFEVTALEPERLLGLRSTFALSGRQIASIGPRPAAFLDALWTFQLKPLPGERTRLVVTEYGASRPRPLVGLGNFLFWEPAHWVMQTRQFANLKRRVEAVH